MTEIDSDLNSEQIIRGDNKPLVERLPDGSRRFTIRVIRPEVRQAKSFKTIKAQATVHAASGQGLTPHHYSRDRYDYRALMSEVGSPDSIEMRTDVPGVVIVNVRHLVHKDNVVSPEEFEAYRDGRAQDLVDDLNITDKTLVCVISSPASTIAAGEQGAVINSRTESTAQAIEAVLEQRNVPYIKDGLSDSDQMDNPDGFGSSSLRLKMGLNEFSISDVGVFDEFEMMVQENRKAQALGAPLPHPDHPLVPAVVYASFAPSLQVLERKTGITELSSGTVAIGLSGFDIIKNYFFRDGNIPEGVDKVVIILARHGQFNTNISEAFNMVTDGQYPILFAGNGSYFFVRMAPNNKGEIVEEYIEQAVKTADNNRTGIIDRS